MKNVEGVIKYLNAVPGMYHSMDSIASLYDIEIDKCLENWRKLIFLPINYYSQNNLLCDEGVHTDTKWKKNQYILSLSKNIKTDDT